MQKRLSFFQQKISVYLVISLKLLQTSFKELVKLAMFAEIKCLIDKPAHGPTIG